MAESWNAGYVTDINYTFGYYQELNPVRMGLAATVAGQRFPKVKTACELGFGQGLSLAMHAASQPGVEWWGTDFNPAQAGFAQDLIARSGADARIFDQAFAEFCARDDLPQFDFIGLHGIWTWISDENRSIIIDFVRRKLAVGGVLYLSYNTLPGWSAAAPLRHLMKQHGDTLGAPGSGVSQRIDAAFTFMDQLFETNPSYIRVNPQAAQRFKGLKSQNRQYLAHEYMNRDWRPMYFSDMTEWLQPAKVSFATCASLLEQQDGVNLTPDQMAVLNNVSDPGFRETVRDFITGQQFRRDLWVRGARKMNAFDQANALRAQRYLLVTNRADVPMSVKGLQGDLALHEAVYGPLLDAVADQKIRTFGQVEEAVRGANLTLAQIASGMAILVGMGALTPVQDERTIAKAKPAVDKLNQALLEIARASSDVAFLASPAIGGGFPVNRFEQLFLLARSQGQKTPAEWGAFAAELLSRQGQKLIKQDVVLETPAENLAELIQRAITFEQRLPLFKVLGIA